MLSGGKGVTLVICVGILAMLGTRKESIYGHS